jgi:glycosyltransferase involved in cell wall biosynthesis
MRARVVINWAVSSFTGWGVYGLNLALQWANDPDIEPITSIPILPEDISVNPIQRHAIAAFLALSQTLQAMLPPFGASRCRLECPVLTDIDLSPNAFEHPISGRPTIGLVFFDTTQLGTEAVARARSLPLVVTGSDWNRRVLNAYGIDNVANVLQGVDPALFHPAPSGGWLADRFCVFSGGKLEYRKAQDIVLAAFRVFAQRHREALLVTAWHCPWRGLARTLDESPLVSPVRFDPAFGVDVLGWAAANGIVRDQILDLGAVPNREMPSVLREMDVAVFPNRCEGGTNLVAMEAMACGLPVVLSRNTGHLDLIEADNCFPLDHQAALPGARGPVDAVPGWGESSVDELIETLETVFADRLKARRRGQRAAESMAKLTWKQTAERLKGLVLQHGLGSFITHP